MKIISLFSGAGGLDLGFEQAGFQVVWANEYDKKIWETFETNFPDVEFDGRDIRSVPSHDIPDDVDGVVGGPPCQSWSEAGTQRGIDDDRGKLFYEYIRILRDKQPKFFLAENVAGMLFKKNKPALVAIIQAFKDAGYVTQYQLLNASDFDVPQDRKRVIFIGFRQDLSQTFCFPTQSKTAKPTLKDAIWDIRDSALPALDKNHSNGLKIALPNHEYMTGDFSSMYMSRNRVRQWHEQSFTIQAGGRHAPIHPQANVMIKVEKDKFKFDPDSPAPYRRLTVREAARVQTFPDDFIFYYDRVADGYKMVGNAVPVNFAKALAEAIQLQLESEGDLQDSSETRIPQQLELL